MADSTPRLLGQPGEQPDEIRLSFSSRAELADRLAEGPNDPDCGTVVVLDLGQIDLIGSLDLTTLIHFALRMRQRDRRVRLIHVQPLVFEVLELTRFHRLAEIERAETVESPPRRRTWWPVGATARRPVASA